MTHTDCAVLSLFGTNGWNEEYTKCLSVLTDLEEVIFFMDGDEAGNKAIGVYVPLVKVMKSNIKISKVETHEGEDINSLVISHEPEILTHLINERIFLFSTEETSTEKEKASEQSQTLELNTENPEYLFTEVIDPSASLRTGLRFTIMAA